MSVADNIQNQAAPGGPVPKKPKTEAQRARERARRKRRRQKQLAASDVQAGTDVPLVLNSKQAEQVDIEPPKNLSLTEERGILDQVPPAEDFDTVINDADVATQGPAAIPEIPEVPAMLPPSATETDVQPEVVSEPPAQAEAEAEFEDEPEAEIATETVPEAEAVLDGEDVDEAEPEAPSQRIFEEGLPPPMVTEDQMENKEVFEEKEELHVDEANLQQAQELAKSLQNDQGDELEEIPQKQGMFGKFFDLLVQLTQRGKEPKNIVTDGEVISQPTIVVQEDNVSLDAERTSGRRGFVTGILVFLVKVAVIAALGIGAFWLGSSLKVIDVINSWFAPPQAGLELATGDNSKVLIDPDLLRQWGFQGAYFFGSNLGNANDLAYNMFFNANYFGKLRDPMFVTETGISAALYYGFGLEAQYFQNKFIFYVNFLAKLRNSNLVKISDVLDGQVRRDQALDDFVTETQALFDEGNNYRKEIATQVDDLKISVNSLNPDKDRYETDFFVALDATKAEKADVLIKNFVETSQKQVELKAKLAGMSRLYDYYEASLIDMKMRLDAIEKNREALISGVSVTETPGVDLNLIRP